MEIEDNIKIECLDALNEIINLIELRSINNGKKKLLDMQVNKQGVNVVEIESDTSDEDDM